MYTTSPANQRRYLPLDRARYIHDNHVIFEQSESDCSEGQSCAVISKYAIYGFNIVFLIVGACLLATGAWLRTDSRFRDFLSERYRQVVNEAFWQASTLYTFSYIIIVLGACMIVVAMFGCCGVVQHSRLFLGFYGFCMFLLLIYTISCVTYVLYKKDGIDVELADALNYMVQHYYQGAGVLQESLDHLQQAFRCCGNAGCSDFRAFRQDPPRTCDIRCDGCHYRIWLALRIAFSVALVVFAIVVLCELAAIAIAMALVFRIGGGENAANTNDGTPRRVETSAKWRPSPTKLLMFDETSNGIDNRLADTNNSSLSQQNYKLFTKVVRSNSLLTSKRGLQLKRQHSWPQIHPITGVALQNRLLMRSSLSGTSSSLMTDSIAINIDNFRSDNVATHNGNDNSSNQDSTLQNDSSFLAFAQLVRHAAEHFSHSPTTSANYASTASTVLPHHTIDMTVDGRHGDLRVVPSPPSAHTSSINTTGDRNVNESGEDNSRNNGNNSGNNGNNNSIPQLRVLLDSREAIYDRFWQYICQNFTEFPNLHFFNVLVLALIVISIVFTQFFTAEFTACCTLFFGFMHYQDSARFMRCVSGASDVYFTLISVLVRNVLILYVFNKQFIFSVVIFREVVSPMTNPNFFSILYRIIASELFVMDITLLCKLAMSKNPFVSKVYKRRVYQWMEYTSVLYRFPIPLVQWCAFFDSIFCVVVYCIVKLLIALPIAWAWSRTTVRLFRYSHLGTTPTAEELKNAEQCTICYNEFTSPVKFNCGHIFCSDCIRTWLDREVTCPICRAIVTKEDNNYRNGNSIVPMHMF